MQRLEETELRKTGRTVGVNCYKFSNISSGSPWRYNLNNQDKSPYNQKVDRWSKLINDKITKSQLEYMD